MQQKEKNVGQDRHNITKWQIFHLSQALTRAKRLEKYREEFHEELYESILYPTVHYDKEFTGNMGSPAVDIQAIRVIELKERYDRRIQREYDRHARWKRLLEWLDNNDKHIMIRYFEKKKSVQPKIINRLLSKIEKRLDQEEKCIEHERMEQSTAEYRVYQELTRAFRKTRAPTNSVEHEDKQQYIINGRFVYMTEQEHADHLLQEKESKRKMYENRDEEDAEYEERKRRRLERLMG